MKPCEINVALSMINEWKSECEIKINEFEKKYNDLCSSYLLNKSNDAKMTQIENNLNIVLKSSAILSEINEVIQTKLFLLNVKNILLHELGENNESNEYKIIFDLKTYIKEKVLNQVIQLLEVQEKYEECNIINQKKNQLRNLEVA